MAFAREHGGFGYSVDEIATALAGGIFVRCVYIYYALPTTPFLFVFTCKEGVVSLYTVLGHILYVILVMINILHEFMSK